MSAVLEESAGEQVRASGFGGVESGEKLSCVASAEKEKGGSLSRVSEFVAVVGVFWYGGEREFCGESACKKVSFVGGVLGPCSVGVLEWWYV